MNYHLTYFNRIRSLILILVAVMITGSSLAQQKSFEFVVLPDTQTYVEEYPEIYLHQMRWLANNKDRFSFALHVGDITQNNNGKEWDIAKKGFNIIEGKLPYSFALGNHDMGSASGKFADTRNTAMANAYFSPNEIPNLVASFPEGKIDNLLSEFKIGDQNWMVLSLEFGPRNKTIKWADGMIEKYSQHNFIIVTHAYVYEDSTLHNGEDWWLPENYGIGKDTGEEAPNNGGQLWEKLIKKHDNISMVFSGHILKSGVGTLVSEGENGNKVYQMLANYQKGVEGSENGGNGILRIIKVNPEKQRIEVKTYSPWLDEFKTEKEHNFTFENIQLK
ncbi:Calcineurin-like phosphoesterase [Salegentibacter agarivorans]|uniref:Calcineurin-like phosphoesterase n=1 Tax=Salegentibacter agarivorans TaxID=345907 RepID=A0A1I2KHY7_9FLAO|nr:MULTISPECIES: metallophosphoesterase [Salegentibacter]APS37491.1 metallophosphatase [Salegentibacter sp. T436]SFF65909.1 Calcineurin-like phosphoesterase [Salegentibacter agarivorans]